MPGTLFADVNHIMISDIDRGIVVGQGSLVINYADQKKRALFRFCIHIEI